MKLKPYQQKFKNEIETLEKKYNVKIRINTSFNSVYFKVGTWNYRISNHKSPKYFKGIDIIKKNRKDYIKKIDDILYCNEFGVDFHNFNRKDRS